MVPEAVEDDALELLDAGVNIRQLGVGVGETVPVAVGEGDGVPVPGIKVGVGVQGNIDEAEELLKELLALELSPTWLLAELELKPKPALDELELKP